MTWKFTLLLLNCTLFLTTLIAAQYNEARWLQQQQQQEPQLQQSRDQVMSIQQRNHMINTEVACKNIMAANLNAGQQPDLALTPRECREEVRKAHDTRDNLLLSQQSASRQQATSSPLAGEPVTTVNYVVLTVYRQPQYSAVGTGRKFGEGSGTNDSSFVSKPVAESVQNIATTTAKNIVNATGNGFVDMGLSQNFSKKLYQIVATASTHRNVLFSPISLQTILSLTYIGSSGQTADELQTALGLPKEKTSVYEQFGRLMKSQRTANTQLQMANKLYYSKRLSVKAEFNQKAKQYFDAEIEKAEFAEQERTATNINQWVAGKTNHRILDLVQPNTLDAQTSAILVNAIYFKAKWAKEFSAEETQRDEFKMNARSRVPVEMMYNEDTFMYGDLGSRLGASVLQLAYKDTDLSMLLVLPHEIEGLAAVESRMQDIDLRTLPQQLQEETVKVQLPKFRIEFELDMVESLQKLHILKLFTNEAELTDIFDNHSDGITKVQHKAFINVNEAGSEAAAATFNKLIPLSLPSNLKVFRADHPFMFAVISPQAVYFVGHVVNFS